MIQQWPENTDESSGLSHRNPGFGGGGNLTDTSSCPMVLFHRFGNRVPERRKHHLKSPEQQNQELISGSMPYLCTSLLLRWAPGKPNLEAELSVSLSPEVTGTECGQDPNDFPALSDPGEPMLHSH